MKEHKRGYGYWLGGGIFEQERFKKIPHFFVYIALMVILIIASRNRVIYLQNKLNTIEKEIVVNRFEYVATRALVSDSTMQSVLARRLAPFGIKESVMPNELILLTPDEAEDFEAYE